MFASFLSLVFLYRVDASCLATSNLIEQPVYSNKAGDFVLPDRYGIRPQKGEELLLSCLAKDKLNKLKQSNSSITVAICDHDDQFLIGGEPYNFGELKCDKRNYGSVHKTTMACNSGVIWYIGYQTQDQFLPLIDICFDENHRTTIYTTHKLFGGAIGDNFTKHRGRPSFRIEGLPQSRETRRVYNKQTQKKRLKSLLASPELVDKYSTDKIFLSKGHLSPAGDFIFSSWRDTTYYFINACPQWQTINSGNWLNVEDMVRKLARASQEDMQVITGTHEVLEILDTKKKFYLSDSGAEYPVPKFIWKIVYTKKSKLAIALVVQNDPYPSTIEFLCKCICKKNGWSGLKQTSQIGGLVHCCDYTSFKLSVSTVPNLRVSGVLQGPNL